MQAEQAGADEAFLNVTFGVQTPVAETDDKPIGNGVQTMTKRIRALYKTLVEENTGG